jgi:hypothetical protein
LSQSPGVQAPAALPATSLPATANTAASTRAGSTPNATATVGAATSSGAAPTPNTPATSSPTPNTLATNNSAPLDARYPDAKPIYLDGFETEIDPLEEWPAGWSRQTGVAYPRYVLARAALLPTPEGKRSMRIQLNGGAAICYSPAQTADARHAYVLEIVVKTEKLVRDRAWVSLDFLDREKHLIETVPSIQVAVTNGWQKLRIGPVACRKPGVQSVRVALHLEPIGDEQDLSGTAQFDDIWLARLPRVTLDCAQICQMYELGQTVTIQVGRTGDAGLEPLQLSMLDRRGELAVAEPKPETVLPTEKTTLAWPIKPQRPGYYEVRGQWRGPSGFCHVTTLPIMVVEDMTTTAQVEFGWTLERADLATPELVSLLKAAGVGRVKLPVWIDKDDRATIEQRASLCEQLRRQGIGVVGVFDVPPPKVRERMPNRSELSAARTLETPTELWLPSIEPIVERLAWHVRLWQWGADGDRSCVGYAPLAERLMPVKTQLANVGQDLTLAVPWDWSAAPTTATKDDGTKILTPWRNLARGPLPMLSADELRTHMKDLPPSTTGQWITLPVVSTSRRTGDDELTTAAADRAARDFVHRMLTAKVQGASSVYVSRPLAPGAGLATSEGAPQPLLLPWRTTASLIGSSEFVGRLNLPMGSDNYLFARHGVATVVVWNSQPTTETLYLGGDRLRQIDLWGQSTRPREQGHAQQIVVGPAPSFITNVNEPVARWMLATKLERNRLPPQLGVTATNSILVTNTFSKPVTGRMKVIPPRGWRSPTDEFELELAPGQQQQIPIEWFVPYNAVTGTQHWRADFEIEAEAAVKFSAFGDLELGGNDIRLNIVTRLGERGDLIVEQRLTNETAHTLQMRCDLQAPGQRRQRVIVRVPAHSEERTIYRLPDGEPLLGQTLWLRCEEINGTNIISRKFTGAEF